MNISDWISHNTTKSELAKNCTYTFPYWYMISLPISQILMVVNSSVNFFIYCAFNNSFRSVINKHTDKIFQGCLSQNYCNQRSREQRQNNSDKELETFNKTTVNQSDSLICGLTYV